MAVTAQQIAQLRRMCALTAGDTTYTDEVLRLAIESFPLPDSAGREPTHADWSGSYDLNAAASRIWAEKAAALAADYDVSADGADLARSQRYEHARRMSRHCAARRATQVGRVHVAPAPQSLEDGEDP